MSDHFDITLERKLETKPGEGDGTAIGVRRIELITGTSRRREWSSREKARILMESAEPGANVSEVARRNGLSPQQLFAWRREARAMLVDCILVDAASPDKAARADLERGKRGGAASSPVDTQSFAPVVLVAPGAAAPPSPPSDKTRGVIEIVIGDALVRVVGKVERSSLAEVLAALRRSS